MPCVNYGREKGEGCGHVKSIKAVPLLIQTPNPSTSNVVTDRSRAALLLWFTMSIIVCLCMYVLVIIFFFILDSRLASFFVERNCPFDFLFVVF